MTQQNYLPVVYLEPPQKKLRLTCPYSDPFSQNRILLVYLMAWANAAIKTVEKKHD